MDTDAKLNALLNDNKEKLDRPVCAFVTFTTQEAKERAMKYYCKLNENGTPNGDCTDGLISNGMSLFVEDAPEPSNIIWENLQTSKTMEKVARSGVILALVICLAITFTIMILLKK